MGMTIGKIDESEFNSHKVAREPMLGLIASEVAWFASSERSLIGTILFDRSDHDWNFVILGPDKKGRYRWEHGDSSFESLGAAESAIIAAMSAFERTGKFTEHLFETDEGVASSDATRTTITDIDSELKRYFAKHPEKLYDLSPRQFEELVASILRDFGFDVELTQATLSCFRWNWNFRVLGLA